VNAPLSLSRAESDATAPSSPDALATALHEALAAQHVQIRDLQATVDDLRGQPDAEATGREVAERALRTAVETVREIDAALRRIELGTYGRCERCGEAIAAERLEVLPYASQCVACPTAPLLIG
jgi:RNA polymerase-binding transcription factor DksA